LYTFKASTCKNAIKCHAGQFQTFTEDAAHTSNAFPSIFSGPVCPPAAPAAPAAKMPTGSDLGQALQLRGGSMDRFNCPGNFMWGLKPGRGLHWLLEVAGSWSLAGISEKR